MNKNPNIKKIKPTKTLHPFFVYIPIMLQIVTVISYLYFSQKINGSTNLIVAFLNNNNAPFGTQSLTCHTGVAR